MINSMGETGDICKDSIEAKKIRNVICKSGPIYNLDNLDKKDQFYEKSINLLEKKQVNEIPIKQMNYSFHLHTQTQVHII